ncbi:MAG: DMT family transporter [Gemmobacter sp.]|nr:DMT family transporter [Gemmobacter sp.]
MRMGQIASVAPFRYTRPLFALILGVAVLHERPDAATLVGSAIIVTSGIYALIRSRKS